MRLKSTLWYMLAAGLMIFWSPYPVDADPPAPLKLGVIQSLSGIAAEDGKTVVQAIRLAVEDLRSKGVDVELVVEDDQSNSTHAVTAFQKILLQKPQAIIAATWDFTTIPLMSLAKRHGVVMFNTSTLPESIRLQEGRPHVFSNAIATSAEAKPFEVFLARRQIKTLAVGYANNPWGEAQLEVYRGLAESNGIKIVDVVKSVGHDDNEWQGMVARLRTKKPQAVLLLLNKNDLEVFIRRAAALAFHAAFFASKNAYDAQRYSTHPEIYEGLCFTYPLKRLEGQKTFRERYRLRFAEEPRIYADNSYDAVFILNEAAQIATKKGLTLDHALAEVSYRGLVGNYEFDSALTFVAGSSSLVCVRGGILVVDE